MDVLETLKQRNAEFADSAFAPDLKMLPSMKTIIIGCVDPRVDPADIFKLEPGEAVVIRNVGGRINESLLETMAILRTLATAAGKEIGLGWTLIVLHHTDCGIIGCSHHAPDLLARYLGTTVAGLDAFAIRDPHEAVSRDVAALRANPSLPDSLTIPALSMTSLQVGSTRSSHHRCCARKARSHVEGGCSSEQRQRWALLANQRKTMISLERFPVRWNHLWKML